MINRTIDKRESPRREMKLHAILKADGMIPARVRTVDVGKCGISLIGIAQQLTPGQDANVSFDMFFGGKLHHADLNGRIPHCRNTAGDGYKAGMEFVNLDSDFENLFAKYVGA